MAEVIIWGIVIYLAYKFIFNIVVPLGKVSSQMKQKINEMNETLQQQQQPYPPKSSSGAPNPAPVRKDDYIDFEEVK